MGRCISYVIHLDDIQAGHREQFPSARIPDGYTCQSYIYLSDVRLAKDGHAARPSALRSKLELFFSTARPIGVICASPGPGDIIVAFRGSRTPFEWVHEGDVIKCAFTHSEGGASDFGAVESGFASIYRSCTVGGDLAAGKSKSAPRLCQYLRAHAAGATLSFTGHSLGAALATLAAADASVTLAGHAADVRLMTFASPMVGDPAFAAAFGRVVADSWRVANRADIVTYLPSRAAGYRHIAADFFLGSDRLTARSLISHHTMDSYLRLLEAADGE